MRAISASFSSISPDAAAEADATDSAGMLGMLDCGLILLGTLTGSLTGSLLIISSF